MGLREQIQKREAAICVLGLGYVGLPLALRFAEAGFPVFGLDIDPCRIEVAKKEIHAARSSIKGSKTVGTMAVSADFSMLDRVSIAIICVPTPLSKTRDPDLSHVLSATETVADHLRPGMLVVLESTTYPGTTRELLLPLLERNGLRAGRDFFLAYSPERIDPGNEVFTLSNTPKVVAGVTMACRETVVALYSHIVEKVVPVSSTDAAEMVKLLENVFRSVNIALVNEFAIMCRHLGLDVWEVIEAAATKPYGFLPFYPGPGLGGHCIPIDPQYLSWKLKLLAYKARFIELADEINREMSRFVVERLAEALNRERKTINGSRILILGVAYKKDIGDIRESPALDIMKLLHERGAEILYHDPYVEALSLNGQDLKSIELSAEVLSAADVVVVVTDHSTLDAKQITRYARLLMDTRNLTRGLTAGKIIRL
jgi:UDP-N-acetyl-D-glucosamine dehydrogenase